MTDKQTTIIEINGVKLEVDLRSAKRIDQLQIGSRVKCLIKGYSGFETCPGVVVGFEPFKGLPSILIAYIKDDYNSVGLMFKTFNAETTDFEIVPDVDNNALEVNKADLVSKMDAEISRKQIEIEELNRRKSFFLEKFKNYFSEYVTA